MARWYTLRPRPRLQQVVAATGVHLPRLPVIAVAMRGLEPASIGLGDLPVGGERVRRVIEWVGGSGARGLRLDATAAGIRPRELDRSGRRDLASLLRRSELDFAGVDAFVPSEHLIDPRHTDRAVASILGAIDLAADLAPLASGAIVSRRASATHASVGITLDERTPADIRRIIVDRAIARSIRLADHAWPVAEGPREDPAMGVGLDPATVLRAGQDPVSLAARLGKRIACARLSDVKPGVDGARTVPGAGRLDVAAYLATLGTVGYPGHAVLDLAAVRDPGRAIAFVRGRASIGVG